MTAAAWQLLLRRPITASLTLSLAVHLALILVVQSRPFKGAATTRVVINARLAEASQLATPATLEEPTPIADPTAPVIEDQKTPPLPPPVPMEAPQPIKPAPAESSLPTLELGVDSTWYLAKQVDEQPQAIGKIEPVYPAEARQLNLGCSLKLRLMIDAQGRVREAEVVEADPPEIFNAAALEAFGNARFKPAMKDGRPVRIKAYYRLDCR